MTPLPAGLVDGRRGRGALLFVAHPGHELRVHGWLGRIRPVTCVLTDGSGATGRSRLEATRRIVGAAKATIGPVFGRLRDVDAYAAVLERRAEVFTPIVDELVACIHQADVRFVLGDAAEGYNPMHDVCRLMLDAAVAIVRQGGQRIRSHEFSLVAPPGEECGRRSPGTVAIRLDESRFAAKLAAARGYAELADEVEAAFRRNGREAFRVECLRPARGGPGDGLRDEPPYYERRGEARVAAGKYACVLRRRPHVLWLAAALWHHAGRQAR